MSYRGKLTKMKRSVNQKRKMVFVLLLIMGFVLTIYLTANQRRLFTAFGKGTGASFNGDIYFTGMSVEGEEKENVPLNTMMYNFDGLADWDDFYTRRLPNIVDPGEYPGLDGCPYAMPETAWGFSSIHHIDSDSHDPQIIEDETEPSSFSIVEGYYTEIYRYITKVYVRLHADMPAVSQNTYGLSFIDDVDYVYQSYYIGEYAPMREVYAKIGININALNDSVIVTGSDMAADGDPVVRFWDSSVSHTWEREGEGMGISGAQAYQKIVAELFGGVIINRDVAQTGYDVLQGFNPIKVTEGINSYYEFNVGFNHLAVPGYYYKAYGGLLEYMMLYDMEIEIPVTFNVVVGYNITGDALDGFYKRYPELLEPGGVHLTDGTVPLPTDNAFGKYNADATVMNVITGLPGFGWFQSEFGDLAVVAMVAVLAFAIAIVLRRV